MTERRRDAATNDRQRSGVADPGSFIGREPERVAESIPGGLSRKDERASAVATRSGPNLSDEAQPDGHREGRPATDDTAREAGQNR
jgi:hypothetical protein